MQARGLKSRKEVANGLGIAETLFARWENGKEIPSNNDISKIERFLKVKLPRNVKINSMQKQ